MTIPFATVLARVAAVLLLVVTPLEAHVAQAQNLHSLKEAMFGKKASSPPGRTQAAPVVARFTSEDGESFVFDSSRPQPLVRFDGEDEVWLLTATPGPKGDTIYKNDVGEPVIKTTRWGGMIVFSDDRPDGDPAALSGKAQAFRPDKIAPGQLWLHMAKAARRASIAVERLVSFDAPDVTPDTSPLYGDAVTIAAEAIVEAAAIQAQNHRALDSVREVQFVEGRPPSATISHGMLVLKLDPSRGTWGGRPSSKRIFNLLVTSYTVADDRH